MCYDFKSRARKSRSWNRFYAKGILNAYYMKLQPSSVFVWYGCYCAVKTICVVCQKLPQHPKLNEVHPKDIETGFEMHNEMAFSIIKVFIFCTINYKNNHNDLYCLGRL